MDKRTRLLHVEGETPSQYGGAVNTPVIRASTILFEDYEHFKSAIGGTSTTASYGRYGTATRHNLEAALRQLEGADAVFLTASGQAAIAFSLLATLSSGDHILVADTVYDPCRNFCSGELKRLGVEVTYYDPLIGEEIADLFQDNTKVLYMESPVSMTFEVQDVRTLSRIAHEKGALSFLDNTWSNPIGPSPFEMGVDVVISALTKYASGHADVMMGSISTVGDIGKTINKRYRMHGMSVSPDDAYLVQRGLRTLAVRLEQQEKTGLQLAEWFKARPETKRLLHPAYESCPGHAHWKRDHGKSCGLFSVLIEPKSDAALAAMFDGMKLFSMGFSWGGYESLLIALDPKICRTANPWKEEGVLLRIHAGLEAPEDLIADLEA